MKKQLLLVGIVVLFMTSFTACKKQDDATKPLRTKIIGKWRVDKIDVTIAGSATTSTNYAATDYLDFIDNSDDDVELSLGVNRWNGSFSTSVGEQLYLNFSNKDLDCKVSIITDNKFQFTGTVVDSNPKITETYYLSR